MRVLLAQSAGFCPGVKQAIAKAQTFALRHPAVWTDGPLIHNKHMLAILKESHIQELPPDFLPDQGVVLIRAHGISPQQREILKKLALPVKDATCPEVVKIANWIQHYAKQHHQIFIFGDPEHAEVIGLKGHAPNCILFPSVEAIQAFEGTEQPCCIVSQSTQSVEHYATACELLQKKCPQLVIVDTICQATKQRQKDVDQLVNAGAEAIVVVGSQHSANTRQLAALAERRGVNVFLIETVRDLDIAAMQRLFRCVGLTAGASTPPHLIEEVYQALSLTGTE